MGKYYVITSAQAKAQVNKEFSKTLDHLIMNLDAELKVLPLPGKNSKEDMKQENFPRDLQNVLEYNKYGLNKNLNIEQFYLRPQQQDPIQSLKSFAQREQSLIFASPKQRWRYVPHSNSKMPKALITPGAITHPNYALPDDPSIERRRLGNIAKRHHEYGAILVKVVSPNNYHWTNILAQRNGSFSDRGNEYSLKGRQEVSPLVMALGDWHNEVNNKTVQRVTMNMIEERNPRALVLHDFFDGHSVSHHYQKKLIESMIKEGVDKDHLSLEKELYNGAKQLWNIANIPGHDREIVIVPSNHNEFLNRYLDEGRFIKDPVNARLAFKLAELYANGKNPVQAGMEMVYGKLPDTVKFTKREEDYKVNGYQFNAHGDMGPGGGRGSIKGFENDFGKAAFGHKHSCEKWHQMFGLGTMLPLTPYYMKGQPTSYTHSHLCLYRTGMQVEHIVKGKYFKNELAKK